MRFMYVLLFIVLATNPLFSQTDTSDCGGGDSRVVMHLSATSNRAFDNDEPTYASGATHVGFDVEYVGHFCIDGIGRFGLGARISNPWVEEYPSGVPVRVRESWLEIPLRYSLAKSPEFPSENRIGISIDFGVYIGGLLDQQILVQPGLKLPAEIDLDPGILGYLKAGVLLDWTIGLPIRNGGSMLFGFSMKSDFTTFDKKSTTLDVMNSSLSIFFGVGF